MYLFYIDESGDTIPLSKEGKKFLVLTGCIIHEENLLSIERRFNKIKKKYFQTDKVEIKSNFLRYANPDIDIDSPIKLHSRERYDELEKDMSDFLSEIDVDLYSAVIDKESYWSKYPSQNPYYIAYIFLIERFQKYLEEKDSLGIVIIDPREGQVEKHFLGNQLSKLHNKIRKSDGKIWSRCENIVEKLLFSQSDQTMGIQIVDLYCYPVFHIFEYNKKRGEYWRFQELTYPKLYKGKGGKCDGYGLKFYPDDKKKDLNFFL